MTAKATPPPVEATVETISPLRAHELLGANVHNRNVRPTVVAMYADDMRAGRWLMTGEAIKLDPGGNLLDGQHRLLACIAADTPFRTVVVRGAPAEAQEVMDSGAKRRLADALKLRGEVDVSTLAAVIALSLKWELGTLSNSTLPSRAACLVWFERNPGIRAELQAAEPLRRAPLYLPVRVGAAFAYRARQVEPEHVDEFLYLLGSGDGLGRGDAIYALRRWVIKARERRTRPSQQQLLALTIRAWNYWRGDVQTEHLSWRNGAPFPELGRTSQAVSKARTRARGRS